MYVEHDLFGSSAVVLHTYSVLGGQAGGGGEVGPFRGMVDGGGA